MKIKLLIFLLISTISANAQITKNDILNIDTEYNLLNTANHPKSKGIDMSIKYPKNWSVKDGRRPNILYLVSDEDGNSFALQIRDISNKFPESVLKEIKADEKETRKEIANAIFPNEKNCKEFLNEIPGLTSISAQKCKMTKIEGIDSSYNSYFAEGERTDFKATIFFINYSIYYNLKLITVAFAFEKNEKLNVENAEIFAKKIANTIIINNLYR